MKPLAGKRNFLRLQIPSCLAEINGVCDCTRAFLEERGQAMACFKLELVARECLNNAILHGNHADERKKTTFLLSLGRKWLCLQISDEGKGFNWRKYRKVAVPEGTAISGRGLPISFIYANQVRFSRSGNMICLRFLAIRGLDGKPEK